MSDRETCACIKHSNIELLVSALSNTKIIEERNAKEVLKAVVCSVESEACMLNKCSRCKDKVVRFKYNNDFIVKYCKWVIVKEERTIKKTKKIVQKMVKTVQRKKISHIQSALRNELVEFKKHVYYEKHQSSELKTRCEEVTPGELVFRIDFSENYVCKWGSEVQSVHFGASKKQLTINTGVRYAPGGAKGVKTTCFATVSNNLDHQAHAVWAHMRPILEMSASEFPNTHTVHMFSDSPSSQYRNRINIYLWKTMLPQYFSNLKYLTWNYTEAGHGKGPMDGVGGTLKRGADQKVLHGHDITCAKEFVEALTGLNIVLKEIPSAEIVRLKSVVNDMKIPPIKGIMQVHQVTLSDGEMHARRLSCFTCLPSQKCDRYHFSNISLDVDPPFCDNIDLLCPSHEDLDDVDLPTCDDVEPCSSKDFVSEGTTVVPKTKLNVDDVYSSSSEEDDPIPLAEEFSSGKLDLMSMCAGGPVVADGLVSGVHIIAEFVSNQKKKTKPQQFIGICQSSMCNNEVDVMFLKECSKDRSLFYVNEKDTASVPLEQIKAVLPAPKLSVKGNRLFYRFNNI